MNRLDKDIELAKQQLSSVARMGWDKDKYLFTDFFKEQGFKIPLKKDFEYSDFINFKMKPNYDKYGKDTVYYFSKWTAKIVVLLGTYSDEEFRSTSHKRLRNRYLNYENYTFVYVSWGPREGIDVSNTIETDSWSGNSYNTLYGYSFKPTVTFMNWDSNPLP